MSDIANKDVQIRDYITDRETYLKLKEIQKNIPFWYHKITLESQEYSDTIPKCFMPVITKYIMDDHSFLNDINAAKYRRALNIIYGIIKGKKYSKIESKVKDDNKFDYYYIKSLLSLFNIDEIKFREALNA